MKIRESYWDIVERAVHLLGCWCLNTLQMGHSMSIFTMEKNASYPGHDV
uniref:Uncharacterized protein n=1 Tax=Rhizophora mucronata TaxID=61149 RepID=A0A2P2LTA1_RHIMU